MLSPRSSAKPCQFVLPRGDSSSPSKSFPINSHSKITSPFPPSFRYAHCIDLASNRDTCPTILQVKRIRLPIIRNGDAVPAILTMHRSLPMAVLLLPDLVLAARIVLEFSAILASAVGEVVAGAGGVGAAVNGLAVAGAGGPDLGTRVEAFFERGSSFSRYFWGGCRGGSRQGENGHSGEEGSSNGILKMYLSLYGRAR